ncbi:Na(+) H(+) antiporter subunit B [Candidatus Syntrophocurvum alkaliphilum]|uniref:Na(+) H(+) antiporter subunit B n=1 Tax=Candidatus Syntrophocurvum alkaliphilum TaxID=2293317 RepID=A0A6I6DGF4_9FIRM|nr:Na(+)/H(+) antiporter subunit B [Candidatus Syntrophocurvum alkaliphilum]QGT99423.1 Na(+) H(+) antiporter subunit B [Candidatus Syntrophocurvum alkaliphilum]
MNRNLFFNTVVRTILFIILVFSIYLFFAGHNNPGGGFIGGLMTSAAFVLLYICFDIETVEKIIPFNYVFLIVLGLLLATGTGIIGIFFGYPYLTQFFDYFELPILGQTELTTALLFDFGIYLVVIGTSLRIILDIAEDD